MKNGLQKVNLTLKDKNLLEKLSGQKIYFKNIFGEDYNEVEKLKEQGTINAQIYLNRQKQGQVLNMFEEHNLFNSLVFIQKKLGLKKIPRTIECYDISHFSGKQVYGSMITFIDARPVRKLYRLFKTAQKNDDYANIREVLTRRMTKWVDNNSNNLTLKVKSQTINKPRSNWQLPNLIIIDGGKGQLSSAFSVLSHFKEQYPQIDTEICALAKQEEEVFLPNIPDSIKFTDQPKFLLQRIRDEAHRFGITNQRKAVIRKSITSSLDNITGIGPITKEKLLSTFGSVENLVTQYYSSPDILKQIVNSAQFTSIKKWIEKTNMS